MKLILVSDTHTNYDALEKIRKKYPGMDLYVHCGDILLPAERTKAYTAVAGNLDDPSEYPYERILELDSLRVLLKHGHDLFIGAMPDYKAVARCAKKVNCDAVFFGHSHVYYDGTVDGIRLLNPGSMWRARDGVSPRTFMIVTIENGEIKAEKKTAQDLF